MTVPDTTSLRRLAEAAEGCTMCELYKDAEQTVFGEGPRAADFVLVGEQPGDIEDKKGQIFVGPAGRMLDRVLEEAGFERGRVYLTNAVKHFHWGTSRGSTKRRLHATPRAPHIRACRPWLQAEIRAVRPKLVVCMGSVATKSAIGPDVRVLRDRGKIIDGPGQIGAGRFMVTIHPSAILRAPSGDRKQTFEGMVSDLRIAADYVRHLSP